MEADFWRSRWEAGQIGFHRADPNPLLLRHFPVLGLAPGARVFLPLCGKTRDIHWLLAQGFEVAGAELSPLAIGQLFAELGVAPEISNEGALQRWQGPGIVIHVGDLFALEAAALGPVDAVYDRAALVALPPELRAAYVLHVVALTGAAPQLLVAYEYDQSRRAGPPFSVAEPEIRRLYAPTYRVELLARGADADGPRSGVPAQECVWRMALPGGGADG